MSEQTAREYYEEIKQELKVLIQAQIDNPSEYKENRIIELKQRLGITEENPDGRKFDDSIIISGPVGTGERQAGIFPNPVGTTLESVPSQAEGVKEASGEEQNESKDSTVTEDGKVKLFGDDPKEDLISEEEINQHASDKPVNSTHFEDTSGYSKYPNRFMQAALQFVVGANAVETSESGEYELTVEDLYIVWWSYIVGNWKALISTTVPGDGLYFEVTHDHTKEETYVDIYKKQANHVFSHHDH